MGRKRHLKSIGLKEKKVKNDGTTFEDIKKNVENVKKEIQEISFQKMKYLKHKGTAFCIGDIVYLDTETGYVTDIYDDAHEVLGYASEASGYTKKYVTIGKNSKSDTTLSGTPYRTRGGRSFGQFHEMLQKAKEGKNVIYATLLGSFEIRYIQPQDHSGGINFDPLCRGRSFGYEEDGHIEDSMLYASRQNNRDGIKTEVAQKNEVRERLKIDLNPLNTLKNRQKMIGLLIFRAVAIVLFFLSK